MVSGFGFPPLSAFLTDGPKVFIPGMGFGVAVAVLPDLCTVPGWDQNAGYAPVLTGSIDIFSVKGSISGECSNLGTLLSKKIFNNVRVMGIISSKFLHIPPDLVVRGIPAHRKPPEVRIWRLRNQSAVGTRPPSTSTPH
jgi:hypothetical protein